MEADDPWQDAPGWIHVNAWSDAAPDKGRLHGNMLLSIIGGADHPATHDNVG